MSVFTIRTESEEVGAGFLWPAQEWADCQEAVMRLRRRAARLAHFVGGSIERKNRVNYSTAPGMHCLSQ